MKIGFYSPYLDSFGGGERYTLTLAAHWAKTHDVTIFWEGQKIKDEARKRLNIDISSARVIPWVRVFATLTLDCLFVLSDGSVPVSFARRNILHLQLPFPRLAASDRKLARYSSVVVNSRFTADHVDPRLFSKTSVIYPPVAAISGSSRPKQKIILSVGRFSPLKKQEVMIDAFKKAGLDGWKLVLVGGLLPGDARYFGELEKKIRQSRIELVPNADHTALTDLYRSASVYWHAAGFGETDPQHMEHFGISTVEAMSAGVVPVVYAAGGQKEIVEHGKNGFLWESEKDLIVQTKQALSGGKKTEQMRQSAVRRAADFDVPKFTQSFDALLRTLSI